MANFQRKKKLALYVSYRIELKFNAAMKRRKTNANDESKGYGINQECNTLLSFSSSCYTTKCIFCSWQTVFLFALVWYKPCGNLVCVKSSNGKRTLLNSSDSTKAKMHQTSNVVIPSRERYQVA